jgi:uncharacterized membrane protein YdjX (TVP38/TMEM64 family)
MVAHLSPECVPGSECAPLNAAGAEPSAATRNLRALRYLAAFALPLLLLLAVWCVWQFPIDEWLAAEDSEQRVQLLQRFFRNFGPGAPAAYVAFVTIEVVVAPIPGLLLYAPGGLIFGAIPGGLLALAGNVLGAGISCGLARYLGGPFVSRLDSQGRLSLLQRRLARHGFWLIVLLRLNPFTSSDLISWAAGLSRMRTSTVMIATAIGMAPLCLLQSWLSDGIFRVWPELIGPLLGLTLLLFFGVLIALLRLARRR